MEVLIYILFCPLIKAGLAFWEVNMFSDAVRFNVQPP